MSNGWIAFVIAVWLIGATLGAAFDQDWNQLGGTNPNQTGYQAQSALNYLTDMKNVSYQSSTAGIQTFVGLNTQYFTELKRVLTFDFGFWPPDAQWLRWLIFAPISAAVLWGLITVFLNMLKLIV